MKVAVIGTGEQSDAVRIATAKIRATGQDVVVVDADDVSSLIGFKSAPAQQHLKVVARYQDQAMFSHKPSRRERREMERKRKKRSK